MEGTEQENKDQNPEEKAKQDNNKIARRFEENTLKLVAIFRGPDNVKSLSNKKIKKDVYDLAIEELTKEVAEEKIKTFKEKAKILLGQKVAFDKFVAEETKKFEASILNKKKEFNVQMEECFSLLSDIEIIKGEYKKSLGGIGEAVKREE